MSDKPDCSRIDLDKCIAKECPGGDSSGAPEGLRVVFGRRAYDEIRKHASEETDREICGVLLGDLCKDAHGPFLHITEIIRGEHTASQGSQVTITHETWNHFHKIKDSQFADKQYLGWYHSHPDFGIFLSAMDLFIHENFFSANHQVALVVDPIRNEEGIFCWKDGKPERAGQFWVGREVHKYDPEPQPTQEERSLRDMEKKVDRLRGQIQELGTAVRERPEAGWFQTALLMGILLLLLFQAAMGWLNERGQRLQDAEDRIRRCLVGVREDPRTGELVLTYNIPSPSYLRTQPALPVIFADGSSQMTVRMDKRDFIRQFMPEPEPKPTASDKGKDVPKDKDAAGGGQPENKPPAAAESGGKPEAPAAPAGGSK